jgi:RNA polymerase sigma-70 factor (ECF subfamily)
VSAAEKTDEQLMALLAQDNREALGDLVRRYQNDLVRFCYHYLRDMEQAKELTQEAFIRVYVARGRFDAKRAFKPWVLCIARNLCLNALKRKKTVTMESLEEYASSARTDKGEVLRSSADTADQQLMAQERREKLAEVLATLDDEAREIVVMRFFERMTAREIAEIVGSTEGAIRTRLHRIIKGLRAQYVDWRDVI